MTLMDNKGKEGGTPIPPSPSPTPLRAAGVFWCEECKEVWTIDNNEKAPGLCQRGHKPLSIGWFEYIKEERRARQLTPKQTKQNKA